MSSSSQSDANYRIDDSEKAFSEDEKTADCFMDDPFSPLNDLAEDNENILTFRAIVIGVMCGTLVNASNIYLGLKSGWSASANLFAVCPFPLDICYIYVNVLTTEKKISPSLATPS